MLSRGDLICVKVAVDRETDLPRRVSVAAVEKIRCVKGTLASPGWPY